MARKLSRFGKLQAILASVFVHVGLVTVLVLSVGWKGFWLPVPEAKSGDFTPLKGFTVVLAPSDAAIYTPNSESLTAKDEQRATQLAEAQETRLKPDTDMDSSQEPESGLGAKKKQLELPENAKSAIIESDERLAGGTPDAKKADGDKNDLLNRYYSAFRQNLALRWQGQELTEKAECHLLVSQLEQGRLVDVVFLDCPVSAATRQQIVKALDKSVALPYQGFEQVISNPMEVTVCFPEMVSC